MSSVLRFAIFLSVVVGGLFGLHWYLWARLVRDARLPAPWPIAGGVTLAALSVVIVVSFVSYRFLSRAFAAPLMWLSYGWLGVMFFLVAAVFAADIARAATLQAEGAFDPERRLVLSRMFAFAAASVGLVASGAGAVGGLRAPSVKRVRIALDRLSQSASGTKIVQLTDVHVGPILGKAFLQGVVEQVNALKPDVVVITGDLVDGSVAQLAEHVAPLASIESRHGVFFVTGNHEYYSGADEWIAHLQSLGVRVLRNERVRIGGPSGFDLAGIDDASSGSFPGHGPDLAKALDGREQATACVLLAHQPRAVRQAKEMGIDLQLSGHTHGGQMFPWNLLVRLQQPFVAGLHRVQNTLVYVSCGTGTWGPPMRLGAPAEIAEIELVASSQ